MMFRSLYSRLAGVMLILFTLVGIFVVLVFVYATDMYLEEVSQKLHRDLAENLVKENILIADAQVDHDVLAQVFHQLMVINPSIELYLLDSQGNILDYSAAPGKVKRNQVSLEPVKKWLTGNSVLPLQGDDPRDSSRRKVFSAARIPNTGPLEGYLYVILGGEQYDTIVQKIHGSYILTLSSLMIAAGIFSALCIGLLLFAMLTNRLSQLTASIKAFKQGGSLAGLDLPRKKMLPGSGDEVDNLSQTFREMAERIDEQIANLQRGDQLRRELVANVSHDLRTPLATLKAYIETMLLKEPDLSADELRYYLQISNKHCRRLNTLIENLFELASLDAKETTLQSEPFNIAELVQDTMQNFAIAAQKKDVILASNFGQDNSFVVGDIGLIERVLENLLTNAIRCTPKGGTVSITLTPFKEYMKVEVLDTGCGIAEESLPHIFERFYKNGSLASQPASISGLGLAIAKRILDLHGSTIEVQSELSRGTRFVFNLPVHDIS